MKGEVRKEVKEFEKKEERFDENRNGKMPPMGPSLLIYCLVLVSCFAPSLCDANFISCCAWRYDIFTEVLLRHGRPGLGLSLLPWSFFPGQIAHVP